MSLPNEARPPSDLASLLEDAPYIDDAGFSARVASALPSKRRRNLSYTLVPSFATLACFLAYLLGGHESVSRTVPQALSVTMTWSFLSIAFAFLLVAVGTILPADE